MFIKQYFSEPNGNISFTREQGSHFAKRVADDFNPLHDVDATRFCIPGDLLFSAILAKYGLSQHMEVVFSGMVMEGTELLLPATAEAMNIVDAQNKAYMEIRRTGDMSHNETLIEDLIRNYVKFSGHTFPDILVPLFVEHNVMINPARPMVMYQSMSIDLHTLDIEHVTLEPDHSEIEISGKRGKALLIFNLMNAGQVVGRGEKRLVLSGLREYDEEAMNAAVADINERRKAYAI